MFNANVKQHTLLRWNSKEHSAAHCVMETFFDTLNELVGIGPGNTFPGARM